ncbi:MAG: flagellar basal body protein FliL [bacterium]|nr:flagellar basal body protein FliL [bacterium]
MLPEEAKQEATDVSEATEADAEGEEEKKGSSIVKLGLLIGGPVVLLAGIAVFLFMTSMGRHMIGLEDEKAAEEIAAQKPKEIIQAAYYDIPELLVNLSKDGRRGGFLKLSIYLEIIDAEASKELDKVKPRIVDAFQTYLRGLKIKDVEGSAGLQRLRTELLRRANDVTAPIEVRAILFREMLIQ